MRPDSRSLLKKAALPALLVTDLTNVRYLTGVQATTALLLVLPKSYMLFVDSRYTEAAVTHAYKDVTVRSTDDIETVMKKLSSCGFEQDNVTVARFKRWKKLFPSTKLVGTSGIVEDFRRSKDENELKHICRAEKITIELLRRIPASLKKGITETALAWKIEQWARELGADGMSFEPIVGFGSHTSRPHHHPTGRKLTKGMIVQVDIGVTFKGYCSDRSEVFFTGPIPVEQKRAYVAVHEAKETAKKAAKRGVSVRKLDAIARDVLKKYDLDEFFTHSLGHGVGLDIHEGVSLSQRAPDQKLLAGEVITIEPGVYFPGKFGIRLEDMVIVS